MRGIAKTLLGGVLVFSLSGCIVAPVVPAVGWIYSDFKAPMDIDMNQTAVGSKSGTAMSKSFVGAVALGDCSIKTAAENGGITTIESVDYKYFNVLGVYQEFTTIVHGK